MDRFLCHRIYGEKPLVQAGIQPSSSEVRSTIECLQHNTSDAIICSSIYTKNYDRVFANIPTLCLRERNTLIIEFWRDNNGATTPGGSNSTNGADRMTIVFTFSLSSRMEVIHMAFSSEASAVALTVLMGDPVRYSLMTYSDMARRSYD
jgi:hypothetical protein